MVVMKRAVVRWLLSNGFTEKPNGSTSHRHFVAHVGGNIKVTVQGHGRREMRSGLVSAMLRSLAEVGYDRAVVKREWERNS